MSWGSNMYGTIGDGVSPMHLQPTRVLLPCKLNRQSVGEDFSQLKQCSAEF